MWLGVNSAFYIQLSLKLLKHLHKLWQDPSSGRAHLSCQKSRQDKAEHHYSHALCHPLQSLNHSLASYLLLSTFPHYVLGQGILWIPQLLLQQTRPRANGVICTALFLCSLKRQITSKSVKKMSGPIGRFGGKRRQEVPIRSSRPAVSIREVVRLASSRHDCHSSASSRRSPRGHDTARGPHKQQQAPDLAVAFMLLKPDQIKREAHLSVTPLTLHGNEQRACVRACRGDTSSPTTRCLENIMEQWNKFASVIHHLLNLWVTTAFWPKKTKTEQTLVQEWKSVCSWGTEAR